MILLSMGVLGEFAAEAGREASGGKFSVEWFSL